MTDHWNKNKKDILKKKLFKLSINDEKKYLQSMKKCRKCKKNTTKKVCSFKDYINFSGAEAGECPLTSKYKVL